MRYIIEYEQIEIVYPHSLTSFRPRVRTKTLVDAQYWTQMMLTFRLAHLLKICAI